MTELRWPARVHCYMIDQILLRWPTKGQLGPVPQLRQMVHQNLKSTYGDDQITHLWSTKLLSMYKCVSCSRGQNFSFKIWVWRQFWCEIVTKLSSLQIWNLLAILVWIWWQVVITILWTFWRSFSKLICILEGAHTKLKFLKKVVAKLGMTM